jgi:hypothetical protein
MSTITINDLILTLNSDRKICKKEKYQPLKKNKTACNLLLLILILLTSCKSEPKKKLEPREIIQNQAPHNFDGEELEVKKQTKKTLDQKTNTEADSLTKSNSVYRANPTQIPIGISINKKQHKSSSGQRKGKIIFNSTNKKPN